MKVYVVLDQTSYEEADLFKDVYSNSDMAALKCGELVQSKYSTEYNYINLVIKKADRYGNNSGLDYGYKNSKYIGGIDWICTLLEYEVK